MNKNSQKDELFNHTDPCFIGNTTEQWKKDQELPLYVDINFDTNNKATVAQYVVL